MDTSTPVAQPVLDTSLTPEDLAALAAVAWGADVLNHGLAVRLRALEAAHPDLVVCTEPKGKYPATAHIPYLGASATKAGRELLEKLSYITSADVAHWTTADLITSSTRLGAKGAVPGDKEQEALGDEPPPWWVPDPHDGLDSNPCPQPPQCDWCGGKGCDICSDPNFAGVDE